MKATECNKVPYDSLGEAKAAMQNFRVDEHHVKKPVRAYKCDIGNCGKFHLTSRDSKTATKMNRRKRDARREDRDEVSNVVYVGKRAACNMKHFRKMQSVRPE